MWRTRTSSSITENSSAVSKGDSKAAVVGNGDLEDLIVEGNDLGEKKASSARLVFKNEVTIIQNSTVVSEGDYEAEADSNGDLEDWIGEGNDLDGDGSDSSSRTSSSITLNSKAVSKVNSKAGAFDNGDLKEWIGDGDSLGEERKASSRDWLGSGEETAEFGNDCKIYRSEILYVRMTLSFVGGRRNLLKKYEQSQSLNAPESRDAWKSGWTGLG